MSHLKIKIIISIVVILVGALVIHLLTVENRSTDTGEIYLYIVDADEKVVFEGSLSYEKGDSFFDILNRHFDLTCATSNYQPDIQCSYSFSTPGASGKVILGIKGDDFELITNWTNNFLAFYIYDGDIKQLSTVGPSNIPFQNDDVFMIQYENPWE